jgi:hypothetical protein
VLLSEVDVIFNFKTSQQNSTFYVGKFIIRFAESIEIDVDTLSFGELLTLQFGIDQLIVSCLVPAKNYVDRLVVKLNPANTNKTATLLVANAILKDFHFNDAPSKNWVVNHYYETKNLECTCYDELGFKIIPNEIVLTDVNTIRINFNIPVKGRAVITFAI